MKPRSPSSPAPQAARPARWVAGVLVAVVVLGTGGAWAWRQHQRVARAQAALLPMPDLSGKPEILADLLQQAAAATRSGGTLLAGVEELGRLYHANDYRREAEACWQFLRAEQPREARWVYYLADLRRAAGDQDGLARLLQDTLRLAPDQVGARLQLANLQLKSGEPEEAARNFQRRLEALPRDPYARLGLVRLAWSAGRKDEARALLEQLLKDTPDFSTAHNLYAELLASAGDNAGAARHRWLGQEALRYREAADPWLDELQASCYDYNRLCVLGSLEDQTENLDRARDFYTRAIQLKPGEAQAYVLMSNLHFKRKEPARARDLLEQALPRLVGPKLPTVFTALSQAYRQLGQPGEAIRVARLGLAQAGETAELYDALGLAQAAAGRHEEAVAAWQAGLARNPGDAGMNFNLAVSLLALRRLDDTLAALDRSLTLQPTFLPTLLLRSEIELDAGHLDLAEKYLRPAAETNPTHPQVRRLMAEWQKQREAAGKARP